MSLTYERAVQEDLNVGTSGSVSVTNPSGGSMTGIQIGIHSLAVGQVARTKTWAPGLIANNSEATTTIGVPGCAIGDFVMAAHAGMLTDALQLTGHVSAAGTVTVVMSNDTGAGVTPTSATLSVLVLKSR